MTMTMTLMMISFQFKPVTGEIDDDYDPDDVHEYDDGVDNDDDYNDDDNDDDIRVMIFISQCRTRENTSVSSTTGLTQSG